MGLTVMAQKYGAWEIESSLGEGGQGQTFRVVGWNGQRGVLRRLKNPKRGWRFEREIDALRQLQSGKIPRLLDTGSNDQDVWVVIEDCGQSLPSRMENDPPFDLRIKWFCDVVEAVCDAHKLGIIHRDIKPNNIVVAQDLTSAYLVDFGICEITDGGPPWTTSEEAFGNAAFAAPECLLGRTEPTGPACDIYSLGKFLYWMLSGGKYILREQLNRIETEILDSTKNIRARVVRLIRKAVAESPAARCSAQEMTTHSRAFLDYIKLLSAEAEQGIVRLIDNLGTDGNFNQSSSRHIASRELGEADIHPNIKMFGFPQRNCAQAERFENYYPYPIQLDSITLGLQCSSLQGEFEILLVGDQDKQPSTQI